MNPDNLNHKTASLRVFRALALFLKVFNLILGEVTLSTQFYIHSLHITGIEGIYAGKRRDYTKQIKDNVSLNEYICYEEDEIHCEKLYDISDYGEDDQEVPSELSSPPSSSIIGEEMEEEGEGGFGHVAGIESSSSHEDLTPKRSKRRDSTYKNPDMKKTESKKNLLNDNLESEIDFNNKGDRNNNKTTKKSKLKKNENLRNGETVLTTSDEPSTRSGKKQKSKSRSPTNLDQEVQKKDGKIGQGDGKEPFQDSDKESRKDRAKEKIKNADKEKWKVTNKELLKDGAKQRGEEPSRDTDKKRTKDGVQEQGMKDVGKHDGKQVDKERLKLGDKHRGKQEEMKEKQPDSGRQEDNRGKRGRDDLKEKTEQTEKYRGKITQTFKTDKTKMLRRKGDTIGFDMKNQQTHPESHKETDAKVDESDSTQKASKDKDKEGYTTKVQNLMVDEDDDIQDHERRRRRSPTAKDKYSERHLRVETEEAKQKFEKEEEIIEKDRLEIARKQELALIEKDKKKIEDLKKQHEKINKLERERISEMEKSQSAVKQRMPADGVPDMSEQYSEERESFRVSFGDVYKKKPDKYSGPGGMTALLDGTDAEFYQDKPFHIPKRGKGNKGQGRKKKVKIVTKETQLECKLKLGDFAIEAWNRKKRERETENADKICRNLLCNLESKKKESNESMEKENTEYALIRKGKYPGFNDRPIELAIIQTKSSSHRNFLKLFHTAFQCSDRVLVKTTWNNFIVFRYCDGKEKAYYLYNGCTCNINRFRYMDLRGGTAGLIRVSNINDIIHAMKRPRNPQRKKQKSHEDIIKEILSQYASL